MFEVVIVSRAIELCMKYYSPEQMSHAIRVGGYVARMDNIPGDVNHYRLYAVALCHDLLEDTKCTYDEIYNLLGGTIAVSINILTNKNKDYETYIKEIFSSSNEYAKIVKRADMKDHLSQEATLTQHLKEKYFPVLKYFL